SNRPNALTGLGSWWADAPVMISKTYPWFFSYMPVWPAADQVAPALMKVSSQVSQVPHGLTPPAQLRTVPEMPTHSDKGRPAPSVVTTVQPLALTAPGS